MLTGPKALISSFKDSIACEADRLLSSSDIINNNLGMTSCFNNFYMASGYRWITGSPYLKAGNVPLFKDFIFPFTKFT